MFNRHRSVVIHPRDLERFRPGLGGIARYFEDGGAAFRATLPEELRADPSLADIKDLPSLAKAFRDTKALVGSSIRVPGPDASPEAKAAFRDRLKKDAPDLVELPSDPEKRKTARKDILEQLGWPKDPAKEFTLAGITLEPGVKLDENELRTIAVELGLDKDGFAKLAGKSAAAQAAVIKSAQAEQSVLKGEWGGAYEERKLLALAAAEKTNAPQSLKDAIKNGTADAATMRWAYGLAQSVGASPRELGDQGGGARGTGLTPAEALSQLSEIEGRKEYFKPTPATMDIHRQLVAKHGALMAQAYPDIKPE